MEALAAAASIVGLVSLAIQLKDKLRVLIDDAAPEQTQDLRKTLTYSVVLLKSVEDLASTATKTNLSTVWSGHAVACATARRLHRRDEGVA